MLNGCGIFGTFVRPMYAFGRPRELRSRGLINEMSSQSYNSNQFFQILVDPYAEIKTE